MNVAQGGDTPRHDSIQWHGAREYTMRRQAPRLGVGGSLTGDRLPR
jgi:hypothetical protein